MLYLSTFVFLVNSSKNVLFTLVYTCCLKNIPMNNNQKQKRKGRQKGIIVLILPCQAVEWPQSHKVLRF